MTDRGIIMDVEDRGKRDGGAMDGERRAGGSFFEGGCADLDSGEYAGRKAPPALPPPSAPSAPEPEVDLRLTKAIARMYSQVVSLKGLTSAIGRGAGKKR